MTSRGSQWHRWDPHIHAPGTILNDQFGGENGWEAYLTELESKSPTIRSIAVTDYYVTDTYERILQHKADGRLTDVGLIFPNVELRLDVAAKKRFVNIHLLVNPDSPDHLEQLKRFLARLSFRAFDDRFDCTRDELIRLGRRSSDKIDDDRAALREGATQFKVNFSELRDIYQEIAWAKKNLLIAVAGGSGDGTSGVREAADKTIREEIEKFAHIIFASSPAQRDFWLGQAKLKSSDIRARFGSLKPCLHGSDAHRADAVGEAHEDRFSWIKGGCTFDSLRQACIDPVGRAYIGPRPPATAIPSQVVDSIEIQDADWLETPRIKLNPGLVTVIGARGSGKTALADMIAAGCDALPETVWSEDESISSSFLARAKPLIGDGRVVLTWGGGDEVTRSLDGSDSDFGTSHPRARYLSQRFVEDLCSSTQGPSDGLIAEIERVIFDAHDDESKDGAISFHELRDRKIDRFRQTRTRETESLAHVSQRIGEEHEKERLIPSLVRKLANKTKQIDGYRADLSKLIIKESEAEIKRHNELTEALQAKQTTIESFRNQKRSFESLQDEVRNMRASRAPELLRETQARIQHSGFSGEQWNDFLLDYKGPVDDRLPNYIKWADEQIAKIKGPPVAVPADKSSFLAVDADLGQTTVSVLEYEIGRLEGLLKADKLIRDQFSALSKRIREEEREKEKLTNRLVDAQGAPERRKDLHRERGQTYRNIFEAILAEEGALADLYEPLQRRLSASSGTLQKLRFSVFRVADAETWANFAETKLLDRRTGQLKGRGTLTDIAVSDLKPVWETGTAEEAKSAMDAFISDYQEALLSYAPVPREEEDAFRTWLGRFAHWLFGTDHLSVRYGISYDGVDIARLSPGTRGIVLLLLYLALDDGDDRPLIIDQPEENLDPKSVYDELVSLFLAAKIRRQVIMVTHNANLVINTDADQIILAGSGDQAPSGLPKITYLAGGLEDEVTRRIVCDILEGGEDAFQERARRLRVRLDR